MADYTINFKKIRQNAIIPTKGTAGSAAKDLYACIDDDIRIHPHYTKLIPTGIALAIPEGLWGGIFARSGLAFKEDLIPGNCVGVIDSDYRQEIMVALHNNGDQTRIIHPQERIAQFMILPCISYDLFEVDELDGTERAGGFGSTGKF